MRDLARWLRWFFPVALLIGGLILFRGEMPFLGEAWQSLRRASPIPVAASVAFAFASITAMAATMQVLLNIQGRITSLGPCMSVTLASNAWSTSLPGGPAWSAWLTYRVHRFWGASTGLSGWFIVISGAISTMWLILIGIVSVVALDASLSLTSLLFSLALSITLATALYWAAHNPHIIKRGASLLPELLGTKVSNLAEQIAALRMNAAEFSLTVLFSLLNRLLDATVLFCAAWAISGEPSVKAIALAYTMTKLAGAAQVTPGGVGTVEAATVGVLVASGFTLVDATATTVLYRLISFVLITTIGWIIYLTHYAGRGFMLSAPAR
ncbi:lysylphosphatidylglycerol synthase transmembrane domain-containing protein [Corynebacterium mayonis]|uniref:lysylphosphatidylglycerol synthase transmembrane domain-containing protein n=1 Tax=Corynebacterium mayonis TaxID=3062461 RepID=UPI0031404A39